MTMKFSMRGNTFRLEKTKGGHGLLNFHVDENETNFVEDNVPSENEENESEETNYKKIRNVHQISGHKTEENMIAMYKQSGKCDFRTKKMIKEVVKRCKVCQLKRKRFAKPKMAMMKAKNPNDIVTLDLKQFCIGGKTVNVLWMICAFSRLAIGKVLKTKEGKEVVNAIEEGWIFTWGCPSTGFWADNGKEFVNKEVDALCDRWKIQIKYGAPYSPW